MMQQLSLTVSQTGLFGILGFSDQLDAGASAEALLIESIATRCGEFPVWAKGWDGDTGIATAEEDASATPVPPSVEQQDDQVDLSGTSHVITGRFELMGGRYEVKMHCGDGYGYAEFLGTDESAYYPTVFNDEQSVEKLDPGFYRLEITCDSAWTISIKPFEV
jgi:hypothetical protein